MNGGYPILLVEDSPDDVLLIERVFNRADFNHPLRTVTDGEKAIEYLKGLEEYSDRAAYPYPGLVILDLKMPGLGGFDVIRWMRGHPQAKLVPIIVISGSSEPADVNRAYELGANAFIGRGSVPSPAPVRPAEVSDTPVDAFLFTSPFD